MMRPFWVSTKNILPGCRRPFSKTFSYLPKSFQDFLLARQLFAWQEGAPRDVYTWQPPQVRVLVSKINSKEGVFAIPHSTLSNTEMQQLEKKVEKLLVTAQQEWETYQWRKEKLRQFEKIVRDYIYRY